MDILDARAHARPALAALALALSVGCYESHGRRDGEPDTTIDARVPDARDASRSDAAPPEMRVCPAAASLGSPVRSVDVVTTYDGCDERCIVVHDVSGPDRDRADLEVLRERAIAFAPDAAVDIGPCCPSRPEAGLCLVVRSDDPTSWAAECSGAPAYPEMWMLVLAEAEAGCFAVRVER